MTSTSLWQNTGLAKANAHAAKDWSRFIEKEGFENLGGRNPESNDFVHAMGYARDDPVPGAPMAYRTLPCLDLGQAAIAVLSFA